MDKTQLEALALDQKRFFSTGKTLDIAFRKEQLINLQKAIREFSHDIEQVLHEEMHKSAFEVYFETGQILKEIRYHIKHLRSWTRSFRAHTPLVLAFAKSYIVPEPYGRVLIFAPWNYPLLLLISPLIGAVTAGNCITLKPSGRLSAFNKVLEKMFSKYFDPAYISLVTGSHDVAGRLLETQADYIFFTGSQEIGKRIMKIAAGNMTPVTLELGGKNPCIVHRDADISIAARHITWGKFINAGQTCVAPDYIAVHNSVKLRLTDYLVKYITADYGKDLSRMEDYTHMISEAAVIRQKELMKDGRIIAGGETDVRNRIVKPTVIEPYNTDVMVMKEEIFGPVLPVIGYDTLEEVYSLASRNPNPLSLYIFTKDRRVEKAIMQHIPSGGVAINDTVLQFANNHLPLGGKNQSGIGKYHGYFSFITFSHLRSVYRKRPHPDLPFRYPPYTKQKNKILRLLLR